MAIRQNPDGSQTRLGGSGSGPYNPAAPGLRPTGGRMPAPTGYGGLASSVQPMPAAPAPAHAGGGGLSQWLQQENRDHVMGSAMTGPEKSNALGGATIMGGNGVTIGSAAGPNVGIHTINNGAAGGITAGYGSAGGGYGGGGIRPGGGYGGGGFGGGFGIGTGLQNDLNAANQANEQRYNEALGINAQSKQDQLGAMQSGYGNVYGTIGQNKGEQMGFLNDNLQAQQDLTANFGNTAHERENRRLASQNANSVQSLVGRGLSNSTVQDSVLKGNATDSAFLQNGIDEDVARQRLGIQSHYGDQGLDTLGRNGSALAAAQLSYADQVPNTIRNADTQRVGIIESRTDNGPNVDAYAHYLSQPGALGGGGYGYGGGPSNGRPRGFDLGRGGGGDQGGGYGDGGGAGIDPVAFMQQYLQGSGYGGGGGGGNPYVDQSTVDANNRIRQQQAQRSRGYGQMPSFNGYSIPFQPAGQIGGASQFPWYDNG